ncbi:NAD-dependent epimerase/dehydratase family protein [Arenimonas oryziterrae]|uniref:NAD-dependent epimerase/dehydratase domain-containing protein n=1 Tax=Arenimonas oryziterrae DSM 21050 = YC6267 TaxID=1121015 RepID=A0A091AUL0_9GAMM|nr:NAD(P)-dependent oxidoreductase [Arenimonas oryziterrae]KFN43126.1 hypothetical protein N789_11225 [Arenimonas oryziterrae DSM 21050 = YC6267]
MRIAITGASGFVGRHVLQALHEREQDVVVVARTAARAASIPGPHASVVLDVADGGEDPFAAMGKPDVLIHLAWDGLPNYQSTRHVETELPAQIRFLAACVRGGLKRLVVTGTCFEYGLAAGELTEQTPTQPCTQYGRAKDRLRQELQAWQADADFELAWLRLFYLFGEGQSEKSLYPLFQAALQRGDAGFDMSGGDQVRDFLPVREAARLLVDVALLRGDTGVVNLCSGRPITVRRLVQSWIDAAGADIAMNLGRLPYSEIEPMAFWGSRARLNALLGVS